MSQSDVVKNDKDSQVNGNLSGASLPPIAAAFLVKFDNRKGYTLAWQQSVNKLDLEGVVEFKSLPSGLHNVKEDLVYFVHDQHVGVSAFLNREDERDDRKARMLAIGVLVPLESGRMGKSWLHADNLQDLCRHQIQDIDDYTRLEQYWTDHKLDATSSNGEGSGDDASKTSALKVDIPKQPVGYSKSRSMSTGTVPLVSNHTLAPHHPALSLPQFLHFFGPLLLPLFRAALLRKRILFLGEAPVEKTCDFVYNLSVLSSIPRAVAESIMLESRSDLRLQPLFNVGITDIPSLTARKSNSDPDTNEGPGWIACTTDDVLCTKPELFDFLVILPNSSSLHPSGRQYPKLVYSSPELSKAYPKYGLRASQRDARKYATLARGILVFPLSSSSNDESAIADEDEPNDTAAEINDASSVTPSVASAISRKSIVEPQSWSRIAYTSLVWWASAGDKRAGLTEAEANENEQDTALLRSSDLGIDGQIGEEDDEEVDEGKTREVAIVSYFHRLTGLIFNVLEDAVRRADSDGESGEERYRDEPDNDDITTTQTQRTSRSRSQESSDTPNDDADSRPLLSPSQQQARRDADTNEAQPQPRVEITPDDITAMGLDVWSAADRTFIEEMVGFWFGREAVVLGGKVECCGIRIM